MITPDHLGAGIQLSVVIPTYNEVENIPELISRLTEVLSGIRYEIIIVDDNSPDLTWKLVDTLSSTDPRIKCIRRLDEKGLSSAVVTGMIASVGDVIAVMDADLQHDESILPAMHSHVFDKAHDICVGSREADGGSYGNWSPSRRIISVAAKLMAKGAIDKTPDDPMSGFFAVSRAYFNQTIDHINPSGFKILLEFVARGNQPVISEVGYHFRNRLHGETKLNATIMVEYLLALIDLKFGWLIPNRFIKFGIIGFIGSLVNVTGFAVSQSMGLSLPFSAIVGIELSILFTYFGNNFFTFTPQTYRGSLLLKGLLLYQFVSIYGLVVQYSVVDMITTNFPSLADNISGLYLAYMVGVAFAAIGNYFLHAHYTWNRLGHRLAKPQHKSRLASLS